VPVWARLITLVAALRVAAALVLYLSGLVTPTTAAPIPLWIYAGLAAVFGALGSMLVTTNRRDPRAAWLGGIFLLLATPISPPVLGESPFTAWMVFLRLESLLPVFMWRFVAEFPSPVRPPWKLPADVAAAVSLVIGVACAAVNLSYIWMPSNEIASDWRIIVTAGPRLSQSYYWVLILGLDGLATVYLLLRAWASQGEDRTRVGIFAIGLTAGATPFILQVLLEQMFPAYRAFAHSVAIEPWVASVVFGSLALVPLVTTYSVVFDRIVDLKVALRQAAQYALARYSIVGLTLVPFAALGLFVFQHRAEPLLVLFAGPRPIGLGAAALLGVLALRLRHRVLDAIDRRFFREPYDARQVLTSLVDGLQVETAEQLADVVVGEVERALHADVSVFVVDESTPALRNVGGSHPPLSSNATVLSLVVADVHPMDVDLENAASPLRRLPPEETQWLTRGGFKLLIALRRAEGPSGLLALPAKRSGLVYSAEDRRLLGAIASAAGLALDNLRLRSTPDSPVEPAARECLECSRLSPSGSTICNCGGQVVVAAAPQVLRGVFRLERRIGAGGMGVVYRAVDLNLGRDVAIKTLPRVTPERVARLRREARTMAALEHPNLAVIHGVETWRGVPFLVQEFLAGGTLKERLAQRRMELAEILTLGVSLAGVLEQLHAFGIVHCDIKPSNIGFTQAGTVKLLDFGLARLLHELETATDELDPSKPAPQDSHIGSSAHGVVGTPHYMCPEAVRGDRPSASFDLWSLGVVLFEAIAGVRPFEGTDARAIFGRITLGARPSLRDLRPATPAAVDAFIGQALALDPSRRYPNALTFGAEIRGLRDSLSLR
jgi:GAF domain-containing protein